MSPEPPGASQKMPPPQTERRSGSGSAASCKSAWCAPANSSGDTAASRGARLRGAQRQVNLNHCRARHSYVRRRCLNLGPNCDPESIYAWTHEFSTSRPAPRQTL